MQAFFIFFFSYLSKLFNTSMKKFYLTLALLGFLGAANAQVDTLFWDDLNGETWDIDPNQGDILITERGNRIRFGSSGGTDPFLPANYNDDLAYSYDLDAQPDYGGRPEAWFRSLAFADSDTIQFDGLLGSNSWFDVPGKAANYFILPAMYATADMVVSWYSAPFQTPLYLDGYKVVVSTETNSPYDFTDTIFSASEFVSFNGGDSANFASYTFNPVANSFIHGQDGNFVEPGENSVARLIAKLRPFSVNVGTFDGGKFVGKTIYIAFVHDSDDDNLISIDNILVTGTKVDNTSNEEVSADVVGLFPNPATNDVNISIKLDNSASSSIQIIDATGKVVASKNSNLINGYSQVNMDISSLSAGIYTVKVTSAEKSYTRKLIKK